MKPITELTHQELIEYANGKANSASFDLWTTPPYEANKVITELTARLTNALNHIHKLESQNNP